MRNCEKNDKELGTKKRQPMSPVTPWLTPWVRTSCLERRFCYKHCKIYLQKKYRCKVSPCLWFEKKSSLTRYCAKKVQKEYRTGSVRNGVTVSKQPGKLMRLLHYLLRKKLLPFVSVEGLKTQAAKSLKFRHARIRQKVPKAYSATTMIKKNWLICFKTRLKGRQLLSLQFWSDWKTNNWIRPCLKIIR